MTSRWPTRSPAIRLVTLFLALAASISLLAGCGSSGSGSGSAAPAPATTPTLDSLGLATDFEERARASGRYPLTVLHTNDTHARYLEFSRFGSSCRADDAEAGNCFGGLARRKTLIDRIRSARSNVLLLDAGDQFQGTLFYSRYKGKAAQVAMNHLRYDAMVTGNHEFDDGPRILGQFVDGLDFPVVVTNLDAHREPALTGRLSRSIVLVRGDQRIGIVGFITEETPALSSPGPTLEFLPVEESLRREIERLERQDVDKIIALSHAGFERDRAVAAAVEGIDIIVGGHTNTLISNTAPDAQGPYPTVIQSPRGEPVLIVTAFAWGKHLGVLDASFDEAGVVREWQGDAVLLDSQILEDPETIGLLASMKADVELYSGEVVGSTEVRLVGEEQVCRSAECNLGNLLADALLEEHREKGIEIALQNGGGIRSSLEAGPITVGNILTVLPFGNTASTFGLSGENLRRVLEHGVSRAENLDNDGTGRFLQVAGLRYVWSADRPVGERILKIETVDASGNAAPIDPTRIYRVVMNAFNRNGGDGFTILESEAIDPYDQGRVVSDILIDYLERHSPVAPGLSGRIVRAQ